MEDDQPDIDEYSTDEEDEQGEESPQDRYRDGVKSDCFSVTFFVAGLLDTSQRTCREMQGLVHALLALRRLPRWTDGIHVELTITARAPDEMQYASLVIGDEGLELSTGGSVYQEGFGSDSYSRVVYHAVPNSFPGGCESDVAAWLGIARTLLATGGTLSVSSPATEDGWIDWNEESEWAS